MYIIGSYWYADPERLKKVEEAMKTGGRVNFPLRKLLPNAGVKPPPVKAPAPQETTPKQGGTK
jgi:hypothetical protein